MKGLLLLGWLLLAADPAAALEAGCYDVEVAGDAGGSCGGIAAFGSARGGIAVVGFGKAEGRTAALAGTGIAEGGTVAVAGDGAASHSDEGMSLVVSSLFPSGWRPW